jgi:hypothetical protein
MDSAMNSASAFFSHRRSEERDSTGLSPWSFNSKGAALIEIVTTMLIIVIISGLTAGIIISMMQLFVYLPRDMRVRSGVQEAIDIMFDGQQGLQGIRYATAVIDASPAQFTYTFGYPANTDKRNVRFSWSDDTNRITRSNTAFGDPVTGPQPPYINAVTIPY